jgi:hypothetical protein
MEFCWDSRPPAATAAPAARNTRLPAAPAPPARSSAKAILDIIVYLSNYRVLVCKEHKTAIRNLDAHLRDHHAIPGTRRREILEGYNYCTWIQEPQEINHPAPLSLPIQELGAPLDALQCVEEECYFVTVNIDRLRKHRKSAYSLPWSSKGSAPYQKVKVQTFFSKPALRRYFVVDDNNNDNAACSSYKHPIPGP